MWRRLCWGLLVLVVGSALVVSGVPSHVYFDTAEEDISSIVSFLSDTKQAAEACLQSSILVNYSIVFDEDLDVRYSSDDLMRSSEHAVALKQQLSYSSDVLDELEDAVSSYQYVKDVLKPLRSLGANISDFVVCHEQIVENFSDVVVHINQHNTSSEIIGSLVAVQSLLVDAKRDLAGARVHVAQLDQHFSTETLLDFFTTLSVLLDRYTGYVDALLAYVDAVESGLFLSVKDTSLYLDEMVAVYGYFFSQGGFVSNQSVELFWNDMVVLNLTTDEQGRYAGNITFSVDQPPGIFRVQSRTVYADVEYLSDEIELTVALAPSHLSLSVDRRHYYLNETIGFFGRLTDYNGQGISDSVVLSVFDDFLPLETDIYGYFSYAHSDFLSFGRYQASVSFSPAAVYQPCRSEMVTFSVDTPTVLSLVLEKDQYTIGETITLSGFLRSGVHSSALANRSVTLFFNHKPVGMATTDENGRYQLLLQTDQQETGLYRVSARFQSEEYMWRSSRSDTYSLVLVMSFFDILVGHSLLLATAAMLGLLIFFVVIYHTRIRALFFKTKKASVPQTQMDVRSTSKTAPLAEKHSVHTLYDSSVATGENNAGNEAILSRYQSLLRALSAVGLLFQPVHTHRDIHTIMIHQGIPAHLSEKIRDLFEVARYAPVTATTEDISLFDRYARRILQSLDGDR